MKNGKHEVIVQKWVESKYGRGTRPNGFSLHLTNAYRKAYIKKYWDGMSTFAPYKYSHPDGTPYKAKVSAKTFMKVKASKRNGIRSFRRPPDP